MVTMFPLLALSAIVAPESLVSQGLNWYFAVVFWPGPMIMLLAYLIVRGMRHRHIHAQFDPCPWCHKSREYHEVPQAAREARDKLRERLIRSETHVD